MLNTSKIFTQKKHISCIHDLHGQSAESINIYIYIPQPHPVLPRTRLRKQLQRCRTWPWIFRRLGRNQRLLVRRFGKGHVCLLTYVVICWSYHMRVKNSLKIQVVPELEKFMDSVQNRVSSIYDMVEFLTSPDIQQKKVCYKVQLDYIYQKFHWLWKYCMPKSLHHCFDSTLSFIGAIHANKPLSSVMCTSKFGRQVGKVQEGIGRILLQPGHIVDWDPNGGLGKGWR